MKNESDSRNPPRLSNATKPPKPRRRRRRRRRHHQQRARTAFVLPKLLDLRDVRSDWPAISWQAVGKIERYPVSLGARSSDRIASWNSIGVLPNRGSFSVTNSVQSEFSWISIQKHDGVVTFETKQLPTMVDSRTFSTLGKNILTVSRRSRRVFRVL